MILAHRYSGTGGPCDFTLANQCGRALCEHDNPASLTELVAVLEEPSSLPLTRLVKVAQDVRRFVGATRDEVLACASAELARRSA